MSVTKSPPESKQILHAAGQIAAGYMLRNGTSKYELQTLIRTVHTALTDMVEETNKAAKRAKNGQDSSEPAVDPEKSVSDDYIVCLGCGRRFHTMRRHILSAHGLTPDSYRKKWSLPGNYPMTAPSYSVRRSQYAKEVGLGLWKRGH